MIQLSYCPIACALKPYLPRRHKHFLGVIIARHNHHAERLCKRRHRGQCSIIALRRFVVVTKARADQTPYVCKCQRRRL